MNNQRKSIISTISSVFIITNLALASNLMASDKSTETAPLKKVMQQLLKDTKILTEALITENYKLIAESSNRIANHQKAKKETRLKLTNAFGQEMIAFKEFDMKVHNAASEINKAANTQDMPKILTNFAVLIEGCQSCHNRFMSRAKTVLNNK